ncbi:MAG TPA: DUF4292 domain-containing protein [Puia sp.]|nr:DUF4292 domain-containing protein [Puia sp.]
MSLHKFFVFAVVAAAVVVTAAAVAGCRSAKKIQKVMATPASPRADTTGAAAKAATEPVRDLHADSMQVIRQAVSGLARNHIDFRTFSGHVHVHYQGSDGKDYEFNAVIHIKKDSIIWASITAVFGIEGFRLEVTPDSVKILERGKKIVRLRSVSYLQDQVHLPVSFHTLQDLLIGNPIFLDTSNILYYRSEKKGLTLFSVGPVFSNLMTLNPDFTPQHSKLDDTDPLRARTGDMTYGDYNYGGGIPFSAYRKVSVAERSKVDIEIGYKQFKFNEPLSYPFSIPKNYKRR